MPERNASQKRGRATADKVAAPTAPAVARPDRKEDLPRGRSPDGLRERLAELIALEADLEVCGEAEDAVTARKAIGALQPDLAIVDITLKDTYGIELVKTWRARARHPRARAVDARRVALRRAGLRAGARGT